MERSFYATEQIARRYAGLCIVAEELERDMLAGKQINNARLAEIALTMTRLRSRMKGKRA